MEVTFLVYSFLIVLCTVFGVLGGLAVFLYKLASEASKSSLDVRPELAPKAEISQTPVPDLQANPPTVKLADVRGCRFCRSVRRFLTRQFTA